MSPIGDGDKAFKVEMADGAEGEVSFSGVNDSFWDTTKYAGIAVDSSSSAAIALDTLTWTQSESSPAIKLNTKPFASLKLILR